MSSSSEVRFEFPESKAARIPGPLEKLWQSTSSYGTMFLSGDEVYRREEEARGHAIQETELRLGGEHERELNHLRCEVTEALAGFERERQKYFLQIEREVVRLALAIARRAVNKEVKADPAILSGAVKEVLQRLDRQGEAKLRVPPADAPAWEKSLSASGASTSLFTLTADPTLPSGKCILETSVGSTSLDPFSELDDIEESLMQAATSPSHPAESAMVQ